MAKMVKPGIMYAIQLAFFALMLLVLAIAGQASHTHLSSYAKGYQVERIGTQWAI
jgi:hypothetical protein